MTPLPVRVAVEGDIPELLRLMCGLAEFEGYAEAFAVTEATLRAQGFGSAPPDFRALVADSVKAPGTLLGMLVYYIIPFTFRARPTLVVKELFVDEIGRGLGLGESLMRAAAEAAVARGCAVLKWQVASWNADAQRFYERLGAVADPVWIDFSITGDSLNRLAAPGERGS